MFETARRMFTPVMITAMVVLFLVAPVLSPRVNIAADISPQRGSLGEEIRVDIQINGADRLGQPTDLYIALQTPDFRLLTYPGWEEQLAPCRSQWHPAAQERLTVECILPAEGPAGRFRLWVLLMEPGTSNQLTTPYFQSFPAGDVCFSPWGSGEHL